MDREDLTDIVKGATRMHANGDGTGADTVLEALQEALREHEAILARQSELIKKLRDELKEVH